MEFWVILVIGIIVAGIVLYYLDRCPHSWKFIKGGSLYRRENEYKEYKEYGYYEIHQCIHCKKLKKEEIDII